MIATAGMIGCARFLSVDHTTVFRYPDAFTPSQLEEELPKDCQLRWVKYLNDIIRHHRS